MANRKAKRTAADRENPAFTEKDMRRAKRAEDIPALAHLSKRRPGERGAQKAPTKKAVSIRLDQDVLEHYRGKGEGWQSRMNADLRKLSRL
jgi:uncharacterized protein (DUF4415 family)